MAQLNQSPDAVQRERQLDAEIAVLGSMLIDPDVVRPALNAVDARDFSADEYRRIFQTIQNLEFAGTPVDLRTVRGKLGPEYTEILLQLREVTPTSANWKEYAALMREQSTLRKLSALGQRLQEAAMFRSLDECRPVIAEIASLAGDSAAAKIESWNMEELINDFMDRMNPDAPKIDYIRYGIPEIDAGTFTEPGDVIMIGGDPSSGKTAFALVTAYHMAAQYSVGFFSLETDRRKLTDRMATRNMEVSFNAIKRRALSEGDWNNIAKFAPEFAKRKMRVFRSSGMTVRQLTAICAAYQLDAAFIDYVQLLQPERRTGNATQDMSEISMSLHTFAQSTGTLIVELAQLARRDKDAKSWRPPDMSDIRQTGQFEMDADTIFLLYPPRPGEYANPENIRILKIAKNKEGRLISVPLYFDGDHQNFTVLHDGQAVMREMSARGRAAKASNRANAEPEYVQTRFTPAEDTDDLPF